MKCPDTFDLAAKYFFFRWMFDILQVGLVVGLWELLKWLWRVADGRSPLTAEPEDDSVDPK